MTTQTSPDAARARRGMALIWAAVGLTVALAVGLVVAMSMSQPRAAALAQPPAAPHPPGIDTATADLLQLDVLPPPALTAPDLALRDQHGHRVSLSSLHGKAVVLSFNDDECPDLCTLLAQDVVAADADLGDAAGKVVFLSVNANPGHTAVADVASWSRAHGLGDIPNWRFVTGTPAQLKRVADSYHVNVSVDPGTGEVVHGTELFFIDPQGREVAIGEFGTAAANTASFAHGMAQMAVDLLPKGERSPVGGPTPSGGTAAAAVGDPAPALRLPGLTAGTTTSIGGTPGKYTVVNFWSSTCTACVQEMPALEKAHRDLGDAVSVLGVDVADPGDARGFARTAGVTYPLLSDAAGTAAGAYRLPGLPFTAIIGPDGTLLVRHAGTFTSEQLEYVMSTLRGS
ncbi:redoxin domain-containing protein [Isoptericola sp. b441]|uniref:Redoxin domain-containing protein n=1 Tax=Actinotalea lenta TaxID=3064654 RepID=A0ABT9DES4_9CELL|nr:MULTISPECIES: redoxin domain-containing protein [unclassified Isoptericola]MDO8108028.1 redoxin domain-containing protein [Isoptericola sp. b441]MDO8120302.1 redoxin domain-containing protein [Isoptericola sp. b490]